MALDALAVKCLTDEIKNAVSGGRIDKIYQPERDEAVLLIRTFTENYRLVLSANASNPRMHFTKTHKTNPQTAPMFCMLLRKHLAGGKITDVRQEGFERTAVIDVESYNELGDLTVKHLIIEIMGRHSNIIMTDADMLIIDCIKRIDITVSSVRQVLPGMKYELPPKQDKTPLPEITSVTVKNRELPLEKELLSQISGISPLTAREAVYRAYGRCGICAAECADLAPLGREVKRLAEDAQKDKFTPCVLSDASGKLTEFSSIDIRQYENAYAVRYFESMNEAIDEFFTGRDASERMRQKSADIVKHIHTLLERAYKKRVILTQTIKDASRQDEYKMKGDIITANLYAIREGSDSAELVNYYSEDQSLVRVSLDPSLTPQQNAQRYYKKYRKAKTAKTEAAAQSEQNDISIQYLESTLAAVENCTSEADINAIRAELAEQGYMKRSSAKKGQRAAASKPLHFVVSGFDIYVGKNNTQNDRLTLKFANSGDIWFHTKQIHGSHVIIKLGTDKNVPDSVLTAAAQLAAFYSKARGSNQVPVDYTYVKNVKKPNGAKPGMVIYETYKTLYVTPDDHEKEKAQ